MAHESSGFRVLFIGDLVGRPGRNTVKKLLPKLKEEEEINFVIVNGENAAGGMGITPEVTGEILAAGVDVITTGNHVWHNRDVLKIIDEEPRLLRPANYPEGLDIPGKGTGIFTSPEGFSVGVLNLIGRVFISNYECPFRVAQREVRKIRQTTSIIFVDIHAEATSEKIAFKWFLDGEVSAIVGTHTHVMTADECVSANGTAYITDVGMTGPHDSVIGVRKEIAIQRLRTQIPARFNVAKDDLRLNGVIVDIDPLTGKSSKIRRLQISVPRE